MDIALRVEEGERQAEIERRRGDKKQEQWRREEAEKRAAKGLKESREDLLQIIARSGEEASRIQQFFLDVVEQRDSHPVTMSGLRFGSIKTRSRIGRNH